MNKKMIALAVAGAMTAPVAMAEVTVYGRVQAEYAQFDNGDQDDIVAASNFLISGDPTKGSKAKIQGDPTKLVDNAMGRVGLKFSEDLGNGLKAVGKYEFKADTIDNTTDADKGSLTGRDSFVGLKGSFGTVTFGRQAGAYKGTNLDGYIATTLEARNGGGQSSGNFGHAGFISNTIKYSNKFGPVKFTAMTTAGNDDNGDSGDNQVAFDYKGGPLRIVAATSTNKEADGTNDDKRTKLGAQYKIAGWKFTAQTESAKDYTPGTFGRWDNAFLAIQNVAEDLLAATLSGNTKKLNVGDVDFMMLQADYKMGKNTITLRIGEEDYKDLDAVNDTTMIALTHKFSKKTRAFVGMFSSDIEGAEISSTSVGLRHDF